MAITITFNDEQLNKLKSILRRECFAKYLLQRERHDAEELYNLVTADKAPLHAIVDCSKSLFNDATSTVPGQVPGVDEDDAAEFIEDQTSETAES